MRYTQGAQSMVVAKFSLAVDRRFAKKDKDQQTADFINCTAFRNTAEFIEKYFRKAKEILSSNWEFFEKIAATLAQKGLLSVVDIQKIKSKCRIVPIALS